jgi:hypothetical protein
MKRILLATIAATALATMPMNVAAAASADISARELLTYCNSSDVSQKMYCTIYVRATIDAYIAMAITSLKAGSNNKQTVIAFGG